MSAEQSAIGPEYSLDDGSDDLRATFDEEFARGDEIAVEELHTLPTGCTGCDVCGNTIEIC